MHWSWTPILSIGVHALVVENCVEEDNEDYGKHLGGTRGTNKKLGEYGVTNT